jgi:hypothetical protein
MNKLNKTECFNCEFCGSNFSHNYNLTKHLKTSKKCLESRPKIDITCIWCEEVFLSKDRLEKHTSKCGINKDIAYSSIKEKNKSLEQQLLEKDNHIKELEEKIFKLATKSSTTTNNNNTTYNITLNCDKPLLLEKERVTELMWRYLTVEDMKLGGGGYCRWFLKHVAVNEKGNITIECTDKNRKIFKYIDDGDKLVTKEGEEIAELIRSCYSSSGFLNQSDQGIEYQKYIEEYNDNINFTNFTNFKKNFIKRLSEETYKENLTAKIKGNLD